MLKAFDETTGKEIKIGDKVTSFRGETATLTYLSRERQLGKSGKVVVIWDKDKNNETETSLGLEYYDKVFNLIVKEIGD